MTLTEAVLQPIVDFIALVGVFAVGMFLVYLAITAWNRFKS